ncbi:MAG TPA: histidinol-phosphate transaminase [Candidatus Krumholzibacteria bacterium]|nr:histidinol-phosphate transaminase [Candidatus Krumholzibacteria bacterium]HPD71571.1 histidinol-phosphate transaminase [Candidatus Krumholzibacteria bacterium]HRY41496.1 histidinol-phosphate transaminase [Candidatus Krumholzibacteria bacterium]
MDLKQLFRAGIREARPYVPGKPVEEVQRELGLADVIKLASNENPEGPLPEVVAALQRAALDVNRYPDGAAFALTRALADHLAVAPEAILLGNGSNEVIDMLVRALVSPGENFVYSEQSFLVYPIIGRVHFDTGRGVPIAPDWRHDLPAMAAAVDERTKLVIICNPNNPTGTYVGAQEFAEFLRRIPPRVIVAIDEAYYEYVTAADFPQTLPLLAQRPNLFVMRTFSKIHSLAGLRVGYGVGHPDLVGELQKTREPFNVNTLSQAGALACLEHWDAVAGRARRNREQLEWLAAELARLGLTVVPSQTNFLFCLAPGRRGQEIARSLLEAGVIVRPLDAFGLPDGAGALRITVGLPAENRRCVAALARVLG